MVVLKIICNYILHKLFSLFFQLKNSLTFLTPIELHNLKINIQTHGYKSKLRKSYTFDRQEFNNDSKNKSDSNNIGKYNKI